MTRQSTPLLVVFDNQTSMNNAIQELHRAGIQEQGIHQQARSAPSHQTIAQNLKDMGIESGEAQFYERAYQAGRAILVLYPGARWQKAKNILIKHDAYHYGMSPTPDEGRRAKKIGAVTPGQRPDDNSQTGVATTADGTQAVAVNSDVIEADIEHAEKILRERHRD
ncbi:hypothetical protein KSF_054000 [Reticulibacter mediterranei]|uniref:Uncharacterized protein n=1 Tax=Reticulibacter mediterranei TaxID=2778369 RepID=A0A8J3IR15_9CHLR|nr:hypothetical protein [Reticulibacter mediterranei]GHO95352.1 hypothetical protein KSF_054000 [Reticulibacter mediterranei]